MGTNHKRNRWAWGNAAILAGVLLYSLDPPDPEEYVARADLSHLWTLFPYNRLDWWPPPAVDQPQTVVYKGPLVWHQSELEPSFCYVFVRPGSDRVYVAADGMGT